MAYYEMMPAGLPAGLQSGMDSVLNKKFGTATSYAPGTWPDTVNLMGPLPEKTIVSSPIADFSDGADDVPTKSLVVTIPPTLTGVSSLGCYVYGKNMIDLSSLVVGYVKTNGTFETAHSNGEMRSDFIPVKPDTTYYFSIFETTGTAADWVGIGEYTTNNTSGFVRRDSYWRFTTGSTTKYIVVSARNLEQATKIQLEIGNDPTTWEAYTAPTVYTANLGRTIYGGTADIVNGTAEPTNYLGTSEAETKTHNSVSITCDGNGKYTATGTATGGNANITFNLQTPSEIKSGMYLHLMNTAANASVAVTLQRQDNTTIFAPALSPANRIIDLTSYVGETIYSLRFYVANGAAFSMDISPMLCYSSAVTPYSPYFDPFTFDGQEINTMLGYNAFWSDSGDTEVTYRADINLALQALSGSRGLMMARPQLEPETEPEETIEETPEEMER